VTTTSSYGVIEQASARTDCDGHAERIRLEGFTIVPGGYDANELAYLAERIDGALLASGQVLSRWLLGVPLAATIGVIAGVLASIPFFGPIASGILAMLLAFTRGPAQALYVAGLCVVIQPVEGNLLMRFVQR